MIHKITAPPRTFFFRCLAACKNTYLVSEDTLRKFLTKPLERKLDERIARGDAHEVILTFTNGCPVCAPDNPDAVVELSVRKERAH